MSRMFESAGSNNSTLNLDLSGWDTSNVTRMGSMFSGAGSNADSWNSIGTLKVYADSIPYIFYGCSKAKATINIYNNPSAYEYAFFGCSH